MSQSRFFFGILIILIGISLLVDFPLLRFAFPLLIIWLGIKMISRPVGKKSPTSTSENSENIINRVLIFSGIKQRVLSDDFQKAELVVVFGGGELDLSQAKTKQKQIEIEVVAVFGGMKIIVPKNWHVQSEGMGILGGFNNKTELSGTKKTTAKIDGVAIFGGVEVVN